MAPHRPKETKNFVHHCQVPLLAGIRFPNLRLHLPRRPQDGQKED
jgi:hypothetical protein